MVVCEKSWPHMVINPCLYMWCADPKYSLKGNINFKLFHKELPWDPLLFMEALSDICEVTILISYTDNTNISQAIKDLRDIANLQQDFNAIYKWAEENNMEFNTGKFPTFYNLQILHNQDTQDLEGLHFQSIICT